ncbi:MAG: type II toxin-antitoxin system death-on-curing family toxin [Desulfobacteria bacterium]
MKRGIRWMPEAAIRAMHAELIAEHGGREGLRDPGLLSSALARPKNSRVYGRSSSIFDLAALYGTGIVRNHPFVDGNKRVALMAMYAFLEMNGYRLEAPEAESVGTMLALAAGEVDERSLSGWLKKYSVPFVR